MLKAKTPLDRGKWRNYGTRSLASIGATRRSVLSIKPPRNIATLPADSAPVKSLFLRELPQNYERRQHPLATPRETGDIMGGENLIPYRDLLVYPLRNENSTGENTRGSDGPLPGCDAAHDCCDS
jgi:hypothetical protein